MGKKNNKKNNNFDLEELLNRSEQSIFGDNVPQIIRSAILNKTAFRRYKIHDLREEYLTLEVTNEYVKVSKSSNGILVGSAKYYFKSKKCEYFGQAKSYCNKIKILR